MGRIGLVGVVIAVMGILAGVMSTGVVWADDFAELSAGAVPSISITPTSKDFGNIAVGKTAVAAFRVTNKGKGSLVIGTVALGGTNKSEFTKSYDACSGKTLKAAQGCGLQVRFTPASIGTKAAEIDIPSNDPTKASVTVALSGKSGPTIAVSATTLTFASTALGSSRSATLRVVNKGTSGLSISSVSKGGTDIGDFSTSSDGCSGKTIKAAGNCTVKVTFAPTSAGSKSALLEILSDDLTTPTFDVALKGTATGSKVTAYYQSGGTATKTNQAYGTTKTDVSAVEVVNSGVFNLSYATITKSGDSSSPDNSSFYGLNAGVLAKSASTIRLSNATVSTTGIGANGVFATGTGTTVILDNVGITCTGRLGHGVDATLGGTLILNDVDITTGPGANSAAIATDRGSGTITVTGGTMTTSGADAPGIYSTGVISVTGASISASGSEAAVIEGANSITLTDTTISGAKKWGVLIYQSMSGDAEGTEGVFTMTGGSLSASVGPLFHVTNSTGVISLKGVAVTATSGTLINASADSWGTSGSNGGTVDFTADSQSLTGNIVADSISSVTLALQNSSSLKGVINSANTAKAVNVTLDGTSTWTVTGKSYITCLTDGSGISGTTISNVYASSGITVYYTSASCTGLGGKTYTLSGGGSLAPR